VQECLITSLVDSQLPLSKVDAHSKPLTTTRFAQAYSEAGGQILFGTDVGYIEQFDTSEEFDWMSRAGMSVQHILASLTTNPAQGFGYSTYSGRIAKGMDADLVLLGADPGRDVAAFSRVRYTIRGGKVVYSQR